MYVKHKNKMSSEALDEIVFQVLLSRMNKKKRYAKPITQEDITSLLSSVKDVLKTEPTMLQLQAGIVIVGDLHGNIDDLIRIFERLRYPPATRYLFLGDYVDRGIYGLEVLLLLFALKVKFPQHIYLIRGNHETESLTGVYGFEEEIMDKYNEDVYAAFIETFYELPLCATVGQRIFCVHGGISPDIPLIEKINTINRNEELPNRGPFCDLTWSDPDEEAQWRVNARGAGYLFGERQVEEFLHLNGLNLVTRSHQLAQEGFEWFFHNKLITVWSAPNYMYRSGNDASVMKYRPDGTYDLCIFKPCPQNERIPPAEVPTIGYFL